MTMDIAKKQTDAYLSVLNPRLPKPASTDSDKKKSKKQKTKGKKGKKSKKAAKSKQPPIPKYN